MYTIIYFSPTGNSKHLAQKLATYLDEYGVDLVKLDYKKSSQLVKNEHLILMYPIHGFNAPRTVKRFVKNLPSGIYNKVSLISVGCSTSWVNDAASLDLRKVLNDKGYPIILDKVLAMPLTFIMEFPDETISGLLSESDDKIKEISELIIKDEVSINNVEYKSKVINTFGKAEGYAAKLFGLELYAKNSCDSCGICWNNCPEYNIKPNKNGKPQFGFNCLMCMKCIYDCPQKSITPRFSKFIPIKKGYSLKKHLNKQK